MTAAKIHVWHTGSVYMDEAMAFHEKTWHPAPFTGWLRPKSKKHHFPVSVYFIEHPKGNVLVDTGWSEDIRTKQQQHLGRLTMSMYHGVLPEGTSVREQLHAHGYTARDIDIVMLSHLHADHVSGIQHVANAKNIVTSDIEWNEAQKAVGYIRSMWDGVRINTFSLKAIPFGPYKLGLDVFDDGTLYFVYTPGHTKGLCSVLVQTNQGWVLLAADVGYAEQSWQERILPGTMANKEEAALSLNWVRDFAQRDDCFAVLANHDRNVQPHVMT
ncbi:N-acyl homoserine lactonase family protein [Paenibacillus sp. 481]|uniref:N-acyl homoserine lactonase family protein n=1 Tax=Paenibacillus sp. 481 TaxID=2835869 RepID=UPI001E64ECB4|nr:N-acyl homoserine lactonase family protein [Paenibacillus sp. 481]UHA74833.1 N-acyl homoserine lactonase family protein [Paenibacillus sp. 481]